MEVSHSNIVDLTHTLLPAIPSWDGSCGFNLEIDADYSDCEPPDLFRTQKIIARSGMGTHIDAPAHCFPGAKTIDSLLLADLIVPCVVIKAEGRVDEDYVLRPDAVRNFEEENGRIPPKSFVILSTGWSRLWTDPERYRNNLRFPSVHGDVAALLLERGVSGLGTDTLSADSGGKSFPVHRAILGAGKYLVENIANAEHLPATGATAFVMPMKIFEGTEAPLRLVALTA